MKPLERDCFVPCNEYAFYVAPSLKDASSLSGWCVALAWVQRGAPQLHRLRAVLTMLGRGCLLQTEAKSVPTPRGGFPTVKLWTIFVASRWG